MVRTTCLAALLFVVVGLCGCAPKEPAKSTPAGPPAAKASPEFGPLANLTVPDTLLGKEGEWLVARFLTVDDWRYTSHLSPENQAMASSSRAKMEPQGVRGIAAYGFSKPGNPAASFQVVVLRFKSADLCKAYIGKVCSKGFEPVKGLPYAAYDKTGARTRDAAVGTFFLEAEERVGKGQYLKAVDYMVGQLKDQQ